MRVERPHAPFFRYAGPGQLVAREAASVPRTPTGRALARVRAIVFGRPLASREPRSRSAYPRRRRWRSSAPTRSRPRPTRPRRSCGSSSWAGPRRCSCRSRSRSPSRSCSRSSPCRYRQIVPGLPERRRRIRGRPRRTSADLRAGRGRRHCCRLRDDRRGVDRVGYRADQIGRAGGADGRLLIAIVSIALITVANLRGLRESGNIFAVPTYLFVGLALSIDRDRRVPDRRPARRAAPATADAVPLGHRGRSASLLLLKPSPAGPSR